MGYFHVDFPLPECFKGRLFKTATKDVEHVFGVLQARWAIVRGPDRYWHRKKLKQIMLTSIILHNMIVEDKGNHVTNWYNDEDDEPIQSFWAQIEGSWLSLDKFQTTGSQVYHQLNAGLIEHICVQ